MVEIENAEIMTMNEQNVAGKKISVIGAARSGLAIARLLADRRADVFVSDSSPADKLQVSALASLGVKYETGRHSDRVYDADVLVLSPGVPSDAPVVREARARGVKIVGELEAASWFCRSPIIAVTGTNGKTTTTTLIGRMPSERGESPNVR